MSFSPEEFVDKLQQLQDTQDSISSSSKWLLSQYRDSDIVAETWKRYVTQKKLPDRKRLLAIYLVNHVVQQGKSQRIGQFQNSFAKVLVDTLPVVFSHFPVDLQGKLNRVVGIWKQRKVFNLNVLEELEKEIKNITTTSSGNSSNSRSSTSSRATVSSQNIPSNVQPIVELYRKLNKNRHNIPALKSRFDNAINELDIHSVVFEENFQTVSKIANVTQDTIKESMGNRDELIKILQKMLHDEEKCLEQDHVLLNEIEFSLDSKDPTKLHINGGNLQDDGDVLPSYGGNDSSDDDSDSDSDSEMECKGKDDDDEVVAVPKRSLEDVSEDNKSLEKKQKLGEEKSNSNDDEEEYIIESENDREEPDTGHEVSEMSVTSNIQDLLSRLAN